MKITDLKSKESIDSLIKILSTDYINLNIDRDRTVELDIGCGKGSFTTMLAEKYPDHLIYAADVLIGRLRKLCKRNIRNSVNNIELLKAEAWHLVGLAFPDNSINRIHLLCPDPWPKERHKGNRLISSEFLGRLCQKLKKNGVFHFSTDDELYYNYVVTTLCKSGIFKRDDKQIDDIIDMKSDFEKLWNQKGLIVQHCAWLKV